jgi:cytoskeletal protein CcmA (bactofilin family)
MRRFALVLFGVSALLASPLAFAEGKLGAVEAPDREGDGAYAAPQVTIPGRIGGDVMIMSEDAEIMGEIGDDARVLTRRYRQEGAVGGELAVMARSVEIDGQVGDDLYAAADDVHLSANARVGQDARIFGKDVYIKGRIDRNLDVSGETVAIAALIGGDVKIHARNIILGPGATIEGKLEWTSPNEPEIPQDAIIRGGVQGSVDKSWHSEGVLNWASPFRSAPRAAILASEAAGRLMVALSAFALGLLLALVAPQYADRVTNVLRDRWAASFGWGLLTLVLTPIAAVLMMLTIIGIPLGFLLLLSMPLLCLWGYAMGAAGLGAAVLRITKKGGRVWALALGLLGLTLIAFIPVIGWIAGAGATLLGLGATALASRPRAIVS